MMVLSIVMVSKDHAGRVLKDGEIGGTSAFNRLKPLKIFILLI